MRYYLIAGEASGDLHGSNLMKALRKRDPHASFRCWGGDRMQKTGGELVKHYKKLAFMGFVEVALHLSTIFRNLTFCKQDIDEYRPDALILIDYPGFNMRIAEYARAQGHKVIYYISPQVWAWKQSRVQKLKRDVDKMLVILPFEKEFYANRGMEVDFVGHPLIDAIAGRPKLEREERLGSLGVVSGKKVVALLPGSRKQEIKAMLPLMEQAARHFDVQPIVAAAPSQDAGFYQGLLKDKNIPVVDGRTYDILEIADAALVTSGTATLEVALFKVPEVVCYKGNWFSYAIARQLVKVSYISLVNLIMDRELVTELIQNNLTVKKLRSELEKCLAEESRAEFDREYDQLIKKLGGTGASAEAARIITEAAKAS